MMIITSSKSVPKIMAEPEKPTFKLPSIIPEKPDSARDNDDNLDFRSGGTTKKFRSYKNQDHLKNFASDSEGVSLMDKLKCPLGKRKSLLQNSLNRPAKSVRKESVKSEVEEIYRWVSRLVCLDFQVHVNAGQGGECVKGIVDKGNNSLLVRQILKARGYWNIKGMVEEEDASSNLVWT